MAIPTQLDTHLHTHTHTYMHIGVNCSNFCRNFEQSSLKNFYVAPVSFKKKKKNTETQITSENVVGHYRLHNTYSCKLQKLLSLFLVRAGRSCLAVVLWVSEIPDVNGNSLGDEDYISRCGLVWIHINNWRDKQTEGRMNGWSDGRQVVRTDSRMYIEQYLYTLSHTSIESGRRLVLSAMNG